MSATSGSFLCGCFPQDKKNYNGDIVVNGLGKETFTDRRFDNQGFEICPEHGERMYGWRSPTTTTPLGRRLDYGTIYGRGRSLKLDTSGEDRRDNRDPQEVAAELFSAGIVSGDSPSRLPDWQKPHSVGSNGHSDDMSFIDRLIDTRD